MNELAKMTRWNPFSELDELQDRMRSLFVRSGNGEGPGITDGGEFADWSPAVDVSEDENEYLITADLPEVKKEDIKITADDGRLTISGERKRETEETKKKWHRVERSYGKYVRSFRLPQEVTPDKIDAKFRDGVLTIHLPKTAGGKTHQHEIPVK